MSIQEKLAYIRTLSGFTQAKLASELRVSFVTLNRWINGKAVPRKGAENRINDLFAAYSGISNPSPSCAGRDILRAKQKEHKNILKAILSHPDLRDQFILSLTYNSNRIEGSTLSEDETSHILFNDAVVKSKSVLEHMEAKNHQAALEHMFSHVSQKKALDESFILESHAVLMNGIRSDAGAYRRHAVRIVGSYVPTSNPRKIQERMRSFVKKLSVKEGKDFLSHSARMHAEFEQIHPFTDGNGRVGRILLNAMLLSKDMPPAVISASKKRSYIQALNLAQLKGDVERLEKSILSAIFEGYRILERR